jgi:hypothetical protein
MCVFGKRSDFQRLTEANFDLTIILFEKFLRFLKLLNIGKTTLSLAISLKRTSYIRSQA